MSRNVFVSYAARDRQWLQLALDYLRKRQLISAEDNIFVDHQSFSAGENFREATRAAISAADTVLVLWSPAAAESKWVNYELAMADALGKHVLVAASRGHRALPIDSRSVELVEVPVG